MNWQSEPPTEPGYYWLRENSRKPAIVTVERTLTGKLVIAELYDETPLDHVKQGEWWGPLAVPE